MADRVDQATRSRIMRAIRSRDTKPELAFRAALAELGIEPDFPQARLPGRPDVVLSEAGLVVFVHGCFWHLCPKHYRPPSGQRWLDKMDANRRRDGRVRRQLRAHGWRTMVVWEHDDMRAAARRVSRRIARAS